MEAISPTGPEAPGDQMDDLKAVKDELLTKITKVDREIAKTESQIAKLKKKYVSFIQKLKQIKVLINTHITYQVLKIQTRDSSSTMINDLI